MIDKEILIKIRKKMEEYNHINFNDDYYDYDSNLNIFQRKLIYSFIKCGFSKWQDLAKIFDIQISYESPYTLPDIERKIIIDKTPKSLSELDLILETKILRNE